ncbi:MAG: glycosyltransferase family 2 protein [Lachnospiraceae bacterium]|nr:glycosyltransferase family 2 protein [Candidatus Colinaster equi]
MISIVVPCYNCEKYINATYVSLINQSTDGYEIVFVDDGSTDNTSRILDEYAIKNSNVKVVHQENGGLMNAWKRGVTEARGEYIVFCDADDYVESNLIELVEKAILQSGADIIQYSMSSNYDDGSEIKKDINLPAGLYDRQHIEEQILPNLYSDGDMESGLLPKSRCSKAIRRLLLLDVMPYLNEEVAFGEDDLTTFALLMNASSIYVMSDAYLYHYVRNAESMIGAYDEAVFNKIKLLYSELEKLADRYGYVYHSQILADKFGAIVLYLKKEICRNPNGIAAIRKRIVQIRECEEFERLIDVVSIEKYNLAARIFAKLIVDRQYMFAIVCTKLIDIIKGKNV